MSTTVNTLHTGHTWADRLKIMDFSYRPMSRDWEQDTAELDPTTGQSRYITALNSLQNLNGLQLQDQTWTDSARFSAARVNLALRNLDRPVFFGGGLSHDNDRTLGSFEETGFKYQVLQSSTGEVFIAMGGTDFSRSTSELITDGLEFR